MIKKVASIMLAAALSLGTFGVLAGCGEVISGEIDETKSQLYVGNYDGGVGTQWLYDAADRFEEMFATTEFEPGTGKVGVEVHVTPDKRNFHGDSLLNNMASSENQIFFTERASYETYATSGALVDLSDIVNEPLTAFGEEESIADKLDDTMIDYLTLNGGIYTLPHYRLLAGIQYNVDLFEYYGFYFAEDGDFVRPGSTDAEDPRSAGPDGKDGTADDGLPATYDQFFELCGYMVERGVTPFIWTGENKAQYTGLLYWALYADYEGRENLMPNFSFDGTTVDDIVTGFDDNGDPVLTSAEITPQNGYNLYQQVGRYYALSFLERILDGGYADGSSASLTFSHLNAQTEFVARWHDGRTDANLSSSERPIAMLLDGNWWYNEADLNVTEGFGEAVNVFGESAAKENRRFAIMPLPKVSEDLIGTPYTLVEQYPSSVLISAYTTSDPNILALAKLFVQFCCTDQELQYFTAETGIPKSYNYDMPQELLDEMTYYGQNVWTYNSTGEVVLPYSSSELYRNNVSSLWYAYDWEAIVGTSTYSYPVDALRNGISARDYFLGMAVSQSDWNNSYSGSFQ